MLLMRRGRDTGGEFDEGVLWERFATPLRAYFARRLGRGAQVDADDLLQECFLRVFSGLPTLRDDQRFDAWIHRVARNVWVDHLRRRGAPEASEVSEPGGGREEPTVEAEDESFDQEVSRWLAGAIDALDPIYADVLRRSELEGVPHKDIARDVGLSVSAIKSRVQRGRDQIRERLQACCSFEFDRYGGIVDYRERRRGSRGSASECEGGCEC